MTAVAVNNNYYKEYQGVDYLSKTFQSSLRFTPSDVARRTVSQENFTRQREKESRLSKTPWGRKFRYEGIGPVYVPDDPRWRGELLLRQQKGHRHFAAFTGDGVIPRIGSPCKVDVAKHVINVKYPAEHPFATHIERANVFPPYEIPANSENAPPYDIPAAAPNLQIVSKARGSAYRHETSSTPIERKPVEWVEGPNFYQIWKGGDQEKTRYYPIPLKLLDPNTRVSRNISAETGRALKILRKDHCTSTYQKDMTPGRKFQSKYVPNFIDGDGDMLRSEDKHFEIDQENPNIHGEDKEEQELSNNERSVHFADNITKDSSNGTEGTRSIETKVLVDKLTPKFSSEAPSYSKTPNTIPPVAAKSFISASYPSYDIRKTPSPTEKKDVETGRHSYSDELIRGWSRSDIRRKFNHDHKDQIPDLRRKPDLRITTNERRHRFPDVGDAGSYVWNGLAVPHLQCPTYQ